MRLKHPCQCFQMFECVVVSAFAGMGHLVVAAEPTAVTAPEVTTDVARNMHEAEAGAAREYLRRIAETFDGSGIDLETQMVEGDPEWVIENQAKELRASLIVMATHARTGLGRLLHGSVADEIVRSSTVPVLLIRASEP